MPPSGSSEVTILSSGFRKQESKIDQPSEGAEPKVTYFRWAGIASDQPNRTKITERKENMKSTVAHSLLRIFLVAVLTGASCTHAFDGPGPMPFPPGGSGPSSVPGTR